MGVTLRTNVAPAMRQVRAVSARLLLLGAKSLAAEHQRRLGVPNPPPFRTPSSPGQYPRLRTGTAQRAVVVEPGSSLSAAETLEATVGVGADGWYVEHLAAEGGRKGLADTLADVRPHLAGILAGVGLGS